MEVSMEVSNELERMDEAVFRVVVLMVYQVVVFQVLEEGEVQESVYAFSRPRHRVPRPPYAPAPGRGSPRRPCG